jgi:hypothetical protein
MQRATLLFDAAQNGLPVIYGPLKERSMATLLND